MFIDTDGIRTVSADVGGAAQALKDAGAALRDLGGVAHPGVQAGLDALTGAVAGALEVLGDDASSMSSQVIAGGADTYDDTDLRLADHSGASSTGGRQLV